MAEMNGKYVNEENHQRVKGKLKTLGILLLVFGAIFTIIGLILLIVGFTNFGKTDLDNPQGMFSSGTSSMGMFIAGGFLLMLGIAGVSYGVYLTFFAHAREILSYGASTIVPVAGEAINYVADNVSPSVNKAVGGFAESISSGIAGGIAKGKASANKKVKCPKCGNLNDAEDKFCGNCGVKFVVDRHCTQCGEKLEENDKFCGNCGAKVE